MGVYIPNLEIPTSCFDCPVAHPALGNLGAAILGCPLIGETLSAPFCEKKRMDNCPLVPVPPHGRLIDADKIGLTDFEIILCQKGNPFKNALEMLLKKIENAPTIIEKAGGE